MTYAELNDLIWNTFWGSLSDKTKEFIELKKGYKSDIYCTLVSFVSSILAGHKFYEYILDEISEELLLSNEVKSYQQLFHDYMLNNCGLGISKITNDLIIRILLENKNDLTIGG